MRLNSWLNALYVRNRRISRRARNLSRHHAAGEFGRRPERLETRTLLSAVSFEAPATMADMTLSLDGSGNVQIESQGAVVFSQAAALVTSLTVTGNDLDNTLSLDFSNGNPIPSGGLTYDGVNRGTDYDVLAFENGSFDTVSHTAFNEHDGRYEIVDGQTSVVNYVNIEPVIDNLFVTDRVFTFLGGSETITLSDDSVAGDGFSQIDSTLGEFVTFLNPTSSLTIDTTAVLGADTINVEGVDSLFNADLIIDAESGGSDDTVNLNGTLTLGANRSLTVAAMTINLPNGTSDITASGTGAVMLTATRNILMSPGSDITTVNGGVALNANQQASPTSGTFVGVDLDGGEITVSGTGNVTINGRGGDTGDDNVGVRLQNGAEIESTATGASADTITINGTGGDGGAHNLGILVTGVGTEIASVDGDITLTGTGGDGSADSNQGIRISTGAAVSTTGTGASAGNITLMGTGGNGTTSDFGVLVDTATARLSTVEGDIAITGTAVAAVNSIGVNVTATGNIAANAGGTITITGTGNSIDFRLAADADIGDPFGTGDISINADSVDLTGAPSIRGGAALVIQPRTASTAINLGAGATDTGLQLDDTELGFIQDGFSSITIGDATNGTGAVTVNASTFTDPVTIVGGTATVAGTLNNTGGSTALAARSPVNVNADITSTGDITITATDSAGAGDDVTVAAGVTVASTGGNVVVNAGDNFTLNSTAALSAASTIAINIDSGNADPGTGASAIISGGVAAPGGVTLTGQGDDDSFTVTGTDEDDLAEVTYSGADAGSIALTADVDGMPGPTEMVTVMFASVENLVFDGTGGDDVLRVNDPVAGSNNVTFTGGTGSDAMELLGGTATTVTHNFTNQTDGSIAADGTTISYTGLEPILDTITATDRIFTFAATDDDITLADLGGGMSRISSVSSSETVDFTNPASTLTINAGSGVDTVNIQATTAGTTTTVNGGDGSDTINLGSAGNSLSGILGNVTIQGNAHDAGTTDLTVKTETNSLDTGDALRILDEGDTTDSLQYDITSSTFTRTGTGTITYLTIETLMIHTGAAVAAGHDINILGTASSVNTWVKGSNAADDIDAGAFGDLANVWIDGMSGPDAINVTSAPSMGYFVQVNGGADADTIIVENTGAMAREELNGQDGTDTIEVWNTGPGSILDIHGGNNTDTINIGTPANSLSGILGDICVEGDAHDAGTQTETKSAKGNDVDVTLDTGDILNLNDQGDAGSFTYTLTATTFTRTDTGTIEYSTIETLNLNTSMGMADVDVTTTAGIITNITTQAVADDIDVADTGAGSITNFTTAGGADSIRLEDTGDGSVTMVTSGDSGDMIEIATTGIGSGLQIDAGAGADSITLENTGLGSVTDVNAEADSDQINLWTTGPGSFTDINGGTGSELILVGTPGFGLIGLLGEICIDGDDQDPGPGLPLTIKGETNPGGGGDSLGFVDNLNFALVIYTIGDGVFDTDAFGVAPILYTDIELLSLDSTSGEAIVNILDTPDASNWRITTGGANDVVTVTTTGSDSNVQVNTGGGSDTVTVLSTGGDGGAGAFGAGSFLQINAGSGGDTLTQMGNGPDSRVEYNGDGGPDGISIEASAPGSFTNINGGAGNDTISVGNPANSLDEISGAICVNGDGHDAAPTVTLGMNTLAAGDVLNVNDQGDSDASTYDITATTVDRTAAATITYMTIESLNVNTSTGHDTVNVATTADSVNTTIDTGNGNDDINVTTTGMTSNVVINSRAGTDDIDLNGDGTDGEILVDAADDNDMVDATGTTEGVTVFGNGGDDVVTGGDGDDKLFGNAGRDILNGQGGNDILLGGGASGDELTGGTGDDLMNGGAGTDLIRELADGDFDLDGTESSGTLMGTITGNDTLIDVEKAWLEAGVSANTIDAQDFAGSVTLLGGDGKDTLRGGATIDILYGEDSVTGAGGAGDDSDLLEGNGGGDLIYAGDGNDVAHGGDGDDIIRGSSGRDTLNGDGGQDTLLGQGASGDMLRGGADNDTLDGGAGNDAVVEEADTDFDLDGTGGNGTLEGGMATGTDTLISLEQAHLTGGGSANTIDASGFDGFSTLNGGAGDDIITAASVGSIVNGDADNDLIFGSDADDSLRGGDGSDTVSGMDGDDLIDGNGGDDFLNGSRGADTISGDDGNDFILGSRGADRNITIIDPGADLKLGTMDDTSMAIGTESSIFSLPGDDYVFTAMELQNTPELLDNEDRDLLQGDAGTDTIAGGIGADQVDGGAGSDQIDVVAGGREPSPPNMEPPADPRGRDFILIDPSLGGLTQGQIDAINTVRRFVDDDMDGQDDNGANMTDLHDQVFADGWDLLVASFI